MSNIAYKKNNVLEFEVNFTEYIDTRFPTPTGIRVEYHAKEYEYIGWRNFDMS